jgi:hypothetical protein
MEEVLRRYELTEEEFGSWQRAFESHGLPGLRATRVQQYRRSGAVGTALLNAPSSADTPCTI